MDHTTRLNAVRAELPPQVSVHVLAGGPDRIPVAVKAATAAAAPLFGYLDVPVGPAPDADVLRALASGRPAEVLLVLGPATRRGPDQRAALHAAGFPLVADVELVGDGSEGPSTGERCERVVFGSSSGKRIEAFKDALWAVDDYAGVRLRDPADPDGHLLDISLAPRPGPLRRELLARLVAGGPGTVTELRRFTVTRTVYRAEDTARALTAMLAAGQIERSPITGRLAGDVVISPIGPDPGPDAVARGLGSDPASGG